MSYDEILLYASIGLQQRINSIILRTTDEADPPEPEDEYRMHQELKILLEKRSWITHERQYHPQKDAPEDLWK